MNDQVDAKPTASAWEAVSCNTLVSIGVEHDGERGRRKDQTS